MPRVKTADLIGPALDWAVHFAQEGCSATIIGKLTYTDDGYTHTRYSPSTNWAQGGPIIEEMKIAVWASGHAEQAGQWAAAGEAFMKLDAESDDFFDYPDPVHGPTPLIAAMSCYVASKLGAEVDIPEGLT